jgi:hypothetical protein
MANRIFSTGTLSATIANPAFTGAAVTVSGAGDASYNGAYTQVGTHNGYPVYQNAGGRFLFNGVHAGWELNAIVLDDSEPAYYGGGSNLGPATANGPYSALGGTAPAPAVVGGGDGAVAETITVPFANLQNISFEVVASKKELWQPSSVSRFPEAVAYYGMHINFKAAIATINAKALALICGLTNDGGIPNNLSTVNKSVALPFFEATFSTQDDLGVPIVLSAGKVSCPGVQIPFKLDDFAMPDFTGSAYPDAFGDVASVSIG